MAEVSEQCHPHSVRLSPLEESGKKDSYKIRPPLHLYLIDVFPHQCRGVFFLADKQHIVFFGHDVAVQPVDDGQSAFGHLHDVVGRIFKDDVRVDNDIVAS